MTTPPGSSGGISPVFSPHLDLRWSLTDFTGAMYIPDDDSAEARGSQEQADGSGVEPAGGHGSPELGDDSGADPAEALESLEQAGSSSDSIDAEEHSKSSKSSDLSRAEMLAARRRKQYRQKKRNELVEARAVVAELTERLDVLLKQNENAKRSYRVLGRKAITAKGWRGVAFRQLQRRMEVESVNRDLRFQVRQCRSAAQVLVQAWTDQLQEYSNRVPSSLFSTPQQPVFDTRDMGIVAAMLEDIQAAYIRADDILSAYKPPSQVQQPYCWEHVWHEDSNQGCRYLEFIEQWIVPFPIDLAGPAMRKALPVLLAKGSEVAFCRVPGVNQSDALKFTYSCEGADGNRAVYRCVFVAQAFKESDRLVICWRSVSEELGVVGAAPIQFNEHGWGVLTQIPDEGEIRPSQPGTSFTLSAKVSMFRPSTWSSETPSDEHFSKFARTMLQPSEKDAVECYEAIENEVLDRLAQAKISR